MDAADFYTERDRRTVEYRKSWTPPTTPVAVGLGPTAAAVPAARILAIGLCNQLARFSRRIHLVGDGWAAAPAVRDAALAVMHGADPYGTFITSEAPAGALAIGIGEDPPAAAYYLGTDGFVGILNVVPASIGTRSSDVWGAALAACLGAAAVFKDLAGLSVAPKQISAWNLGEGGMADPGAPDVDRIGIGRVLMVGAGQVGSALAWWVSLVGHETDWTVVDGDMARVHNLNRSLGLSAADAGWRGGAPRGKDEAAAHLLGARANAIHRWYDEWARDSYSTHDVVLALANERGVRHALGQLQPPVLLHATTTPNWQAQLHRHVPGVDDCIDCRMGDLPEAKFECSTAPVSSSDSRSGDAALPFLSAAAGVLLAVALIRLQHGELTATQYNFGSIDFLSEHRRTQVDAMKCSDGCASIAPEEVRRAIPGGRWGPLDPARR